MREGAVRQMLYGIAILLIRISVAALLTARTSTPAFLGEDGQSLPGSIAEERYMALGGVPQYILNRRAHEGLSWARSGL